MNRGMSGCVAPTVQGSKGNYTKLREIGEKRKGVPILGEFHLLFYSIDS
jgi:hypothetical protein